MDLTDAQRHAIAAGKQALNTALTKMTESRAEAHRIGDLELVGEWDSHIVRTVRDIDVLDDMLTAPLLGTSTGWGRGLGNPDTAVA